MKPFRTTKNVSQIYKTITKAYKSNTPITLWQNVDDKRLVVEAIIKNINRKDKKITLIPQVNEIQFNFSKEIELYIKTSDNYFLFKGMIDFTGSRFLSLYAPTEMHIVELRASERKKYEVTTGPTISIDFPNKVTSDFQHFNFSLFDISVTGAGIIVDSNQIVYLKKGMIGIIRKIGKEEFNDEDLKAEIVYVLPLGINLKVKSLHSYRLGIRFLKKIRKSTFELLQD